MSHIGSWITACIHPSEVPSRMQSLDDVGPLGFEEGKAVYVFSRNGWINNCVDELSVLGHLGSLPTRLSPAAVFDSTGLKALQVEIGAFLERLPTEPALLPELAREQADEAEMARCLQIAPATLDSAMAALGDAKSRDEESDGLETLLCLLWCVLRLAEHAGATGLNLICVRSQ